MLRNSATVKHTILPRPCLKDLNPGKRGISAKHLLNSLIPSSTSSSTTTTHQKATTDSTASSSLATDQQKQQNSHPHNHTTEQKKQQTDYNNDPEQIQQEQQKGFKGQAKKDMQKVEGYVAEREGEGIDEEKLGN
ncbi:20030_t:CDS:2, partial [Entrophospora sp. SA101]